MDDHTFRTRLEAIMGMSHNDQQHQLDALNLERQHQCQIIATPLQIGAELFNCFEFALGLHTNLDVRQLREKHRLSLDHLALLVDRECVALLASTNATPGDVVYYLDEYDGQTIPNRAKHAGIILLANNETVIESKWGRKNDEHIWRHPLNEVPAVYEDHQQGITVLCFRPNKEKLEQFAKEVFSDETEYFNRTGRQR
jgi:hypothetical protein